MIRIEEINSFNETLSLKEEWDRIVCEAGLDISSSFDFVISLWEAHFDKKDIILLLAKDDSRTVGIFLLFKFKKTVFGILPVKAIWLLTNIFSIYNNFICMEEAKTCFGEALNYVRQHYPDWDVFEIINLIESSNVIQWLKISGFKHFVRYYAGGAPYIDLKNNWDDYLRSRSNDFQSQLKNKHRKCEKIGKVEFKEFISPDDVDYALGKIYEIEGQSWKEKAGISIRLNEKQKRFYEIFFKKAAPKGNFHAFFLCLNGDFIAFRLLLFDGKRSFFLKSAYKENFGKVSPGVILMEYTIRKMHELGLERDNLLLGNVEWKLQWATGTEKIFNLYLYNSKRPYSIFIYYLKKMQQNLIGWRRDS